MNDNGHNPTYAFIDDPIEGIDYSVMEKMLASKLEPNATKDKYQKYADLHGITRAEAKWHLLADDYGMKSNKAQDELKEALGESGCRSLKSELQRIFGGKK